MKTGDVATIRLLGLKPALDRVCRRRRKSRSEIVRDALARYLALAEFEDLRRKGLHYAERAGYLTDEDVFEDIS